MRINLKRYEYSFVEFVHKNLNILYILLISLLALAIRNEFRGWISGDLQQFMIPWSTYFEEHNGFAGIASGPLNCDYPVIYQYILAFLSYLPGSSLAKIKAVSVFFDFVSATFIMLIVREVNGYSKKSPVPILAYALALLIPTPILNSAAWGQCDSIYSAFLMISLYFLIREKHPLAFIAFGFAFAFKLQSIFFFPVLLLLYFKRKDISLLHFLIVPAVVFLVSLPAIIIGKPLPEIFGVYFGQVTEYAKMTMGFPNLYSLLPDIYWQFATPGIILTFSLLLTFYFVLLKQKNFELSGANIVEVSLLTIMICTYTLPAMHQRYLFSGDLIAVIYMFTRKERPYVPLIIWLISVNGYMDYLFAFGPLVDQRYLALAYLGSMVLIARDMVFKPHSSFRSCAA